MKPGSRAAAALEPDLEAITGDGGADDAGKGYEPMAALVSRKIREAILDGRLQPGERIRQEDIARRLGTSRIPVREALRQLETEGLVTLVPHSGARVSVMDYDGFQELYRLREIIEPMAIGESAPRLTDAQLDRLRALAAVVDGASGDPHRWLEADRRFHLESYQAAPLPRVLTMIEGFWNQTQQYRRAYLYTIQEHLEIVTTEHRMILDALERRDGEDAATLQRLHIRRTRMTLSPHSELFHG